MATINSGITMRIIPQLFFQFGNVVASNHITVPLGVHIEAGPFTEVDVLVRLHNGTSLAANQTLTINLLTDGYDFEDPGNPFFSASALASLPLTNANTVPYYGVFSASASSTPFGRFLAITLQAQQPAAGGVFNVNISVDMTLKGGDPSAMPMAPNSYRGYRIL
jgi:hypothetical protein